MAAAEARGREAMYVASAPEQDPPDGPFVSGELGEPHLLSTAIQRRRIARCVSLPRAIETLAARF